MMEKPEILEIENAKLMGGRFKNFSGAKTEYNREGDRYINIKLPEEMVEPLENAGWTIKTLKPKEEGDAPVRYINVKIRYKSQGGKKDPKIYKGVSADNMHLIKEENVGDLDKDEIVKMDIVINPSYFDRNGKEGYSAYLDTLYVIIKGNRFQSKYNVIDEDIEVEEEDEEEE